MGRKARIEEIDGLRALAFLAVVMQHTIGHYDWQSDVTVPDGVLLTVLLLLVKFAVPLFIFITGLVLFYNYDGELKYFDFVRKRIKDIIVPYLIWTLVYFLYNHEWGTGGWETVRSLVHVVFTGKSSYHLWYVVMIFQFYLLFPVFRWLVRLVKPYVRTVRAAFLALVVLGVLYLCLTAQVGPWATRMGGWQIPVLTPLFTTYADRNFLYFSYYFLLGAVAGLSIQHWRAWVVKHRVVLLAVWFAVLGYFVYKVTSRFVFTPNFKMNTNDTFLLQPRMAVFLISSIPPAYLLAMRLQEKVGPKMRALIERIGNYSYGAYLVHVLMLEQAIRIADAVLPFANVTLRTLLTFLLCALFALLLTYLLSFLPFGKAVVGVARRKK